MAGSRRATCSGDYTTLALVWFAVGLVLNAVGLLVVLAGLDLVVNMDTPGTNPARDIGTLATVVCRVSGVMLAIVVWVVRALRTAALHSRIARRALFGLGLAAALSPIAILFLTSGPADAAVVGVWLVGPGAALMLTAAQVGESAWPGLSGSPRRM